MSARAQFNGPGEVGELGKTFNNMAQQTEEQEKRLIELDRLKSEFVSSITHELRTPLATIKTFARMMLRKEVSEAERREYLQIIIDECDRQIDLVLNLFDLSRLEAGSFEVTLEEVDAAEVIRSCVLDEGAGAKERGQDLRVELPDELPSVKADYGALRRVVCLLIDNAVKYTSRGGQISVAAEQFDGQLAIRVSDRGAGISADDLPHVFEKFYRGSFTVKQNGESKEYSDAEAVPGAGIGLYLARQITELMDGRVSVESELGRGSVFTVSMQMWNGNEKAYPSLEG